MALKVLLLGGTGFLGRSVGRQLIEAGHRVRVLVRDEKKAADYFNKANVVVGDALDPAVMVRACAGAELAISCVGVRRNRPQSILAVNVDGPRTLAWAAKQTGMRGVIYVSASGARLDPKFRFLSSRWMGEDQLKQSGVPTAILRFCPLIGDGGGVLRDFERATRTPGPVIVFPGTGKANVQPIVVDDAARCIVETLNHPELVGQTLEIGGPTVLTYNQLFEAYCQARGVSRPVMHAPIALLRPAAAVMELVMRDPLIVPDELRQTEVDNLAGRFDVVQSTYGFAPMAPSTWISSHVKPPPAPPPPAPAAKTPAAPSQRGPS